MEINEKLDTFFHAAIAAANEQSESILEEQKTAYQESLLEYEKLQQDEQQTRQRIAEEKVRKDVNRTVSEQIMSLKKEYHAVKEKQKEELFILVEEKLEAYQKTKAYQDFLVRKILDAKAFANGEEMTVYLNPSDEPCKEMLEEQTKCALIISSEDFKGGIRAVIRSKNVLIDDSFASRIRAEKEGF